MYVKTLSTFFVAWIEVFESSQAILETDVIHHLTLYPQKKRFAKANLDISLITNEIMAGVVGIEPTSSVLETVILPLNYTPTLVKALICIYDNICQYFFKKCWHFAFLLIKYK